jgi:hypothetical protein
MRKGIFLMSLIASFVLASAVAYSAEFNLGPNNFTVKLDSINFGDNALKHLDNAYYIGFEGYGHIGQNFYLGAEVGYVNADKNVVDAGTEVNKELIFIPLELNLKYTIKVVSHLIFDLGAGFSYNYAKEEISGSGISSSADDWLWGGQFFADMNYKIGQIFLGANTKYQITGRGNNLDHRFDNWRIGGQIGVMF